MERVEQPLAVPGTRTEAVDEVDLIPVRTYSQLVRQRFLQHRLATAALIILTVLVAIAIVVPVVTDDAWKRAALSKVDATATIEAPLGYNDIGQNIAVRLAKGLQTSLMIGFAAVLIISIIGVTVGAIAGFFG